MGRNTVSLVFCHRTRVRFTFLRVGFYKCITTYPKCTLYVTYITQQEKVACLTDQNPSDQGCRAFIPPQYCNCVFANIPHIKLKIYDQIIFMNSCHSFSHDYIISCLKLSKMIL